MRTRGPVPTQPRGAKGPHYPAGRDRRRGPVTRTDPRARGSAAGKEGCDPASGPAAPRDGLLQAGIVRLLVVGRLVTLV